MFAIAISAVKLDSFVVRKKHVKYKGGQGRNNNCNIFFRASHTFPTGKLPC